MFRVNGGQWNDADFNLLTYQSMGVVKTQTNTSKIKFLNPNVWGVLETEIWRP